MTTPSWPAELPQFADAAGYAEEAGDNVIRTKPDAGPVKRRRRFTAAVSFIRCQFGLTLDQVETWEEFLRDGLADGANSFTLPHPRTRATITVALAEDPKLTPVSGIWWNLQLRLEVQP